MSNFSITAPRIVNDPKHWTKDTLLPQTVAEAPSESTASALLPLTLTKLYAEERPPLCSPKPTFTRVSAKFPALMWMWRVSQFSPYAQLHLQACSAQCYPVALVPLLGLL